MIVIADAGPLIAFFDAKCESFLELAFSELIIPQAVFKEVFFRRAKPSWIKIREIDGVPALALLREIRLRLDPGVLQRLVTNGLLKHKAANKIVVRMRESGVYLPAVTFTVQEVRKTRREAPP